MTRVKICGLSTPEAVRAAVDSGADYLGFVFAPSRRQVSLSQAQVLRREIPEGIQVVGVFVSPSLTDLEEAIRRVPLDLVQIHGHFDDSDLSQLSVPVIRAIQVDPTTNLPETGADYLLFDAPIPGSGARFDWENLDTRQLPKPYFIAGGLTSENVQLAIDYFQPYGVDVSSGVETEGQKDRDKIKTFIESVKQ